MPPPDRHEIVEFREHKPARPDLELAGGCQMDPTPEDLHHRLDQLRFLASETDDPLAERLVRDLIVELEDRLIAGPRPLNYSPG